MRKLLLFLSLLCPSAFGAFTEFYCQSGGTNINAGSEPTNAAAFTFTFGSWVSGTGVYTNIGANLSQVTAGMWASVYTNGNTVTTFVGRITAVDDTADTITISLVARMGNIPATSITNINVKVGGAWHGPFGADGFPLNSIGGAATNSTGNSPRVNLKNDAIYNITNGITCSSNSGPILIEGYTTTVDDGGLATFDGSAGPVAFTMVTVSGKNYDFRNLRFQTNGPASGSSDALSVTGTENSWNRVVVHDVRGSGFVSTGVHFYQSCEAYNCDLSNSTGKGGFTAQSSGTKIHNCIAHHNTNANATGFQLDGGLNLLNCIAFSNGSSGFRFTADVSQTINGCVAFMNGVSGFEFAGNVGTITDPMVIDMVNCVAAANKAFGISVTNNAGSQYLNGQIDTIAFGTGTGITNGGGNFVTLAGASSLGTTLQGVYIHNVIEMAAGAVPWVDWTTGDFRNSLVAIKNTGFGFYLQTYTNGTFTGTAAHPDIGSAQSTNSASTGGASSYTFSQ